MSERSPQAEAVAAITDHLRHVFDGRLATPSTREAIAVAAARDLSRLSAAGYEDETRGIRVVSVDEGGGVTFEVPTTYVRVDATVRRIPPRERLLQRLARSTHPTVSRRAQELLQAIEQDEHEAPSLDGDLVVAEGGEFDDEVEVPGLNPVAGANHPAQPIDVAQEDVLPSVSHAHGSTVDSRPGGARENQ